MSLKMFSKFLICSLFICLAAGDVKHLARTYLPPSTQEGIIKFDGASRIAKDVLDLQKSEIIANDLKLENAESLTKDAATNDPAYGNIPFGYNGYNAPGFPNQGFPGQLYPHPVLPPPPGLLPQIIPGPGFPPSSSFVNPGFSPQGYPGPFYSIQGFPGQRVPLHGFYNPGFSGPAYPPYPIYFSSPEEFKPTTDNESNKLQVRVNSVNSETQYDAANGGYLYKKPTLRF